MEQSHYKWSKTVFRLRKLPNTVETLEDVVSLVEERLGSIAINNIRVFSLATTLNFWENPSSKVATVMFGTVPPLVRDSFFKSEWYIPARSIYTDDDLILDTHFIGMTPLNDVKSMHHLYE
jgi:hypothetical protein